MNSTFSDAFFDNSSYCVASESHDYFNLDAFSSGNWEKEASQIRDLIKKDALCLLGMVSS